MNKENSSKMTRLTQKLTPNLRKVQEIKKYEFNVLQIQQELSYSVQVNNDSLWKKATEILLNRHWAEIAYERNLNHLCGYSLCHKSTKDPDFHNVLTDHATLDLLDTLPSSNKTLVQFCCHRCRLKMKILFTSSPPEPPYLRRESKYPHLSVNESKRLSDPQQPFQPNAIEGYIPTPTVFTLLVIVFEKLITQRTKSYVKQNSSVTNPLPCTLQTKVIIHTTEENMNLKDEEPNADGEFADVVPVETDLFFSQLRKISQKVLSFLPTTEPYTFFTHLEQLSQTFQCVDKAVHLLISHNIYSWIFVLVCLWGTCQCSSELKSSVIDSGALKNVLEQILLPVARNTGLCINHDIVEKIGEMVFY